MCKNTEYAIIIRQQSLSGCTNVVTYFTLCSVHKSLSFKLKVYQHGADRPRLRATISHGSRMISSDGYLQKTRGPSESAVRVR